MPSDFATTCWEDVVSCLLRSLAVAIQFKAGLQTELKAFNNKTFDAEVLKLKASLPVRLAKEQLVDGSLCAVLLVAAKVELVRGTWGQPQLCACLCKNPGGGVDDWKDVVGTTVRKGRGRCVGVKKPLRAVFNNMEWPKAEDGKKVGFLKHFLTELGLNGCHAEERADTCNKHLASVGHSDRVEQKRVPGKAGSLPFVASKDAFRVLYDFF